MKSMINRTVLMSGTKYFRVEELNPYSHRDDQPDIEKAAAEFAAIKTALEEAGIRVIKVDEPADCQDGIYTANWALCRGNKAVMSRLPNLRQAEEPYAEQTLRDLGKEIITPPKGLRFSGQGDSLPCGNLLFTGSTYRTDLAMHQFLADALDYEVVSLQAAPALDQSGTPIINHITGWPDSFYYDIDLALSVISENLIAWCPEAFTPDSQAKIRALTIEKIEVGQDEAQNHFACNLVSTGETVIMSASAPELKANLEAHGLKVITPQITELAKGGGYIRCTTLTLDN